MEKMIHLADIFYHIGGEMGEASHIWRFSAAKGMFTMTRGQHSSSSTLHKLIYFTPIVVL